MKYLPDVNHERILLRTKNGGIMKQIILLGIIIAIAGCATPGVSTSDYSRHEPKSIKNEIQVDQPYTQVWDRLVRELSKSFYVINNIDKESRIINISFSTQTPTDFVDCGEAHRTYKRGKELDNYDYNVADSSSFKFTGSTHGTLFDFANVRRTTTLEGRSNIYLAPLENDKNKTTVAVNTRYILTIETAADAFSQNMYGQIMSLGPDPHSPPIVISFNTNKPENHTFGDRGRTIEVTCFSNGKLEQDVLGILQK